MPTSSPPPSDLPADWHDWPIIPPREGHGPTRVHVPTFSLGCREYRIPAFVASDEQAMAAVAEEFRPLAGDPRIRLGRFEAAGGPGDLPTLRIEWIEDRWTVFGCDLWISRRLGSLAVAREEWLFADGSWFGRHLGKHAWDGSVARSIVANVRFHLIGLTLMVIPAGLAATVSGIEIVHGLGLDEPHASTVFWAVAAAVFVVCCLVIEGLQRFDGMKTRLWGAGFYFPRRIPMELAAAARDRQERFHRSSKQAIRRAFSRLGVPEHSIT